MVVDEIVAEDRANHSDLVIAPNFHVLTSDGVTTEDNELGSQLQSTEGGDNPEVANVPLAAEA